MAPVPHWSGDTVRNVRLVRHGNRQLKAAIHRIADVQFTKSGPGRDKFQSRRAEGDTAQRALRSLKRRITRVVYNRLKDCPPAHSDPVLAGQRLPRVFMLPLADLQVGRQLRLAEEARDGTRANPAT